MKKSRNSEGKEENDRALWEHVTRSVKAYGSAKTLSKSSKPEIRKTEGSKPKATISKLALPKPSLPQPVQQPKGMGGFDRATETKLRRGQLPLEGTLDLHGLTQAEAFSALHQFIHEAVRQEKRTVLIITGKGRRVEGVLKRMVPQWLEEPGLAAHIVAMTPAHQKDGGSGAFYVRLKKRHSH